MEPITFLGWLLGVILSWSVLRYIVNDAIDLYHKHRDGSNQSTEGDEL